jgi:polyisoprenoid-binding protein YceI
MSTATLTDQLQALIPGTWNVDVSHSRVGFVARHLMISKVRGHFGRFSGSVEIDPDPLRSSVHAEVETASVETGDDARDAHLRNGDFFDVERYPTLSFQSTGVRLDGDDLRLVGDLTVKDVTRPVELAREFDGVESDPWGGTRAGFTATTEINRRDFGLEWNVALDSGGMLVGEKVKIELEVELVKA